MTKKVSKTEYRKIASVLTCAADLLVKNRWIRGSYHDWKLLPSGRESNGYCALGAIRMCSGQGTDGDYYPSSPVQEHLAGWLKDTFQKQVTIVSWNDSKNHQKRSRGHAAKSCGRRCRTRKNPTRLIVVTLAGTQVSDLPLLRHMPGQSRTCRTITPCVNGQNGHSCLSTP